MKTKILVPFILFLTITTYLNQANAALVIRDIQVIDLGTIRTGTMSTAYDINDSGLIVGVSQTRARDNRDIHAFVKIPDGVGMIDLHTMSGDYSVAYGINNLGQVVGKFKSEEVDRYGPIFRGFLWEPGIAMYDLGSIPMHRGESFLKSNARAINDRGLIGGSVAHFGAVWSLFAASDNPPFPAHMRMNDMGSMAPRHVYDINNAGQAVGLYRSNERGFRWQAGFFEELSNDIGRRVYSSAARGINEFGGIVGNVRFINGSEVYSHATYWPTPAIVNDLGTLGGNNSVAYDINNSGTVVGQSQIDTGETRAFIWHADFGMQSLGTLGGSFSRANAINSSGQVVGVSETSSGERHATLWKITYGISLDILIRPPDRTDAINPSSRRNLSVVIFSRDGVDALSLDLETISLGDKDGSEAKIVQEKCGKGEGKPLTEVKDVDNDGKDDLILYFSIPELVTNKDINENTKRLYLQGSNSSNISLFGADKVSVVKEKK